ncbi:MAG TPA: DNA polymerase III subunit gamma/tau [Candidatus Paceibacterota bacterium]|jgi:DNA polymerase-3 subunit gamma/tau|nr:DNA polymerase III, subunit gamma and tau [Parcubacteria group bacterium]MDP6119502.1 DNA polymerase III subunit gamma/tau [Candidatus Paceibacterota bacterium]HJN63064.1 DNA polymerase III subunit gamma/tau [Candidatus Paceibacterota bacterium]|tara:strand:- start:527 stop:1552 length:1026 start_codon:yes stop_codon:yes gene_type:complete
MEIALYRKYRPQKFNDVLGQEHITDSLSSAIKLGNISHAYLFSGTRGTGKTSVARIFANEIGTTRNDLYEIDAASNRGIDDIRELRDAVNIMPFESKYKVYIIDEAHMLTKEAFNALLKTLEEPPAHAIFILATTEVHKLPDTIVSRCEPHGFRKPSHEVLKNMIVDIAKKEGFRIDPSGVELISILGDSSFRDTQGILQKTISSSKNKEISLREIEKVTGAPSGELVNDILKAISEKELDDALEAVGKAVEKNVDMKIFLKLILHKARLILLIRYASDMKEEIKSEVSEKDYEFLKKMTEEAKINSNVLKTLLDAYRETSYSYIPQLPFELALVEIIGQD